MAARRVGSILLGLIFMVANIVPAQAGTMHYYYTDAQGTVLAKADAQGNLVASYDYAPYGTQVLGTPPSGPAAYTGHVNDAESGFVYMQARYYDPAVGRFLSVDPVGPSPGNLFHVNRYDYANNNPIMNTDPDGRESPCITLQTACLPTQTRSDNHYIAVSIGANIGGSPTLIPAGFIGVSFTGGITQQGQLFASVSYSKELGVGLWGGAGMSLSVGNAGYLNSGLNKSKDYLLEGNFGAGEAIGGSVSRSSVAYSLRYGGGAGIQLSGGVQESYTVATPSLTFPAESSGSSSAQSPVDPLPPPPPPSPSTQKHPNDNWIFN